jgi:hypothetical protein
VADTRVASCSFADAEARENPPKQIIGRKLAGDFGQALLSLPQVFGHELTRPCFEKLAMCFTQMNIGAL